MHMKKSNLSGFVFKYYVQIYTFVYTKHFEDTMYTITPQDNESLWVQLGL